MTTSPIVSITDELLAELKLDVEMVVDLSMPSVLVEPSDLEALLTHIADLKQKSVEREAHIRNLIDSETLLFNYLADIRQAVGDDGCLMLPELVEHIRGMSQQLAAAAITAENCEMFRRDAERYQFLRDSSESIHQFYLSTPIWFTGVKFSKDNVDAAIDAARDIAGDD